MTSVTAAVRARTRAGFERARRRLVTGTWPVLQQTVTATVAWVVAEHVIGHHDPFFAPIAAVVALNTSFGERGSNALRLLQGVVVGIVVGEVTLSTFSGGYGQLPIALFVAMAIARATGGARVTVAQAAAGAILTVAVGNGETGIERLTDALIGAGVALVFTQFLFSPEPLGLLHRAESAALAEMARGLRLTGQALADTDDRLAGQALESLRTLRDRITELARVREASIRVARHSLVWRRRTPDVLREKENAGYLDLLGDSCLMLTRIAAEVRTPDSEWLSAHLDELAGTMRHLSRDPDDAATRQQAVSRALRTTRQLAHGSSLHASPAPQSPEETTIMLIRIVAADLMMFSGLDPGQAREAAFGGGGPLPAEELEGPHELPDR